MAASNPTRKRAVVAATGALGISAALRARHRRLRNVAAGLRATVLPPDSPDPAAAPEPAPDESHAPGHQHLGPAPTSPRPERRASWPRRADKLGHPGRFF